MRLRISRVFEPPCIWYRLALVVVLACVALPWAWGVRWGLPSSERNALTFRDGVQAEDIPSAPDDAALFTDFPVDLPGRTRLSDVPRSAFNPIRSFHPDEYFILKGLKYMVGNRTPYPGQHSWPPLQFYAVGAGLAAGWAAGYVDLSPEARTLKHAFTHPDELARAYIVGRFVTLLFALIAVIAAYKIGNRLYEPPAGIICALFLTATPAFSYHAGFMTADVPMLAWVLLAAWCAVLAMREGQLRWYLLAGACVGLAAATRYKGALAAFTVVAAHACGHNEGHRKLRKRVFDVRLWASGAAAIAVFLLIDHWVFTAPGFFETFRGEAGGSVWPAVSELGALKAAASAGLGLPMMLIAGVGLAFMLIRNMTVAQYREDAFLLLSFLPPAVLIFLGRPAMVRYWFPALPMATFAAGLIGTELVIARPTQKNRALLGAGVLVILLVAALSWMHGMAYAELRAGEDPRIEAGKWVARHVPPGSTIGVLEDPWQFRMPPLDAGANRIVSIGMDALRLADVSPDYVIYSDYHLPPLAIRGPLDIGERYFLSELGRAYETAAVFARAPNFCGVRFSSWRAPHDMRYLNPRIKVLRKR